MRVGLFSPMGTGNLGDVSIQDAVIYNLKKRIPSIKIFGFSLNPEDTALRHKIPSFPITRLHWEKTSGKRKNENSIITLIQNAKIVQVFRRLLLRIPQEFLFTFEALQRVRKLDIVIFSGGGQLVDIWNKGDRHCYSILRWTFLAKISGIPVFFISVGAGPLKSAMNRRFVKWALSMATYRSFRDIESRQYIANIGFDRSDPIVPDLAHSLPEVDSFHQHRKEKDNLVVGISPMAYLPPWYDRDTEIYKVYLNKLASFIKWLIENQIQIVLFPSCVPSDYDVIKDLTDIIKNKYKLTLNDNQIPIQTVSDLLTIVSSVDLVVASRYHGILLSLVMHKPVIALSYHPKDISLMTDMGQEVYCFHIEEFDVQLLIDGFLSLKKNITKAQSQIIEKENEYRMRLDRQYEFVIDSCLKK